MEGDVDLIKKAITSFQRVRQFSPKNPAPLRFLAIANAELGLDQDAKTILEPVIKRGADLRKLMNLFPKKDPELREKIANGLLKAGLPGEPGGYYKIFPDLRLKEQEISDLLFDNTMSGFDPFSGKEWTINRRKDGNATYTCGEISDTGTSWIENDMVCNQWKELYGGYKDCMTIFKNPEPRPDRKEAYLSLPVYGIYPFSTSD